MRSKSLYSFLIFSMLRQSKSAQVNHSTFMMNMEVQCNIHERPLYNYLNEEEKDCLNNTPKNIRSCVWVLVPKFDNEENPRLEEPIDASILNKFSVQTTTFKQHINQDSQFYSDNTTFEKIVSYPSTQHKHGSIGLGKRRALEYSDETITPNATTVRHQKKRAKNSIPFPISYDALECSPKLSYEIMVKFANKLSYDSEINGIGRYQDDKNEAQSFAYICVPSENFIKIQNSFAFKTDSISDIQKLYLKNSYENFDGIRIIHCCEGINSIKYYKKYIMQLNRLEDNDQAKSDINKSIKKQSDDDLKFKLAAQKADRGKRKTKSYTEGVLKASNKIYSPLLDVLHDFNVGDQIIDDLSKLIFSSEIELIYNFLNNNFYIEIEKVGIYNKTINLEPKIEGLDISRHQTENPNQENEKEIQGQNEGILNVSAQERQTSDKIECNSNLDAKSEIKSTYSNFKVKIKNIIYNRENCEGTNPVYFLFLEMPELIFYLDWKIKNNLILINEKSSSKEIILIQNVLEHYKKKKDSDDFLIELENSINHLRTYIKNYLEEIYEPDYPQILVYLYALEFYNYYKYKKNDQYKYSSFVLFIITFKLKPAEIVKIFVYKKSEITLERLIMTTTENKFSSLCISRLLYVITEELKKNNSNAGTNRYSSRSILYPFRKRILIFSKCGLCNNLVITYASWRQFYNFFYLEIVKVMTRNY